VKLAAAGLIWRHYGKLSEDDIKDIMHMMYMRFIIYSDAIDNDIDGDSTTLSKRIDRYNNIKSIVKNDFLNYLNY